MYTLNISLKNMFLVHFYKTYWARYALIVLCIWTTNSKTIISYLLKKHAAYLTFQVDYLIKYVLSGFGTPWG